MVIGQSNAVNMVKLSNLSSKLTTMFDNAHVINCGHGGQAISKFLPNWDEQSFYGDCIKQIGDKTIGGIIFWQGETDAMNLYEPDQKTPLASTWAQKATSVLKGLRQDTGQINIPIILVIINNKQHSALFPNWQSIRLTQQRFNSPHLYKLDSNRYPFAIDSKLTNDPIHLTPAGYNAIGAEIANIFWTLTNR